MLFFRISRYPRTHLICVLSVTMYRMMSGNGKVICKPQREMLCITVILKSSFGNRTICLNEELTSIHQEVLNNLESIHGALLRMNRSIQAEGIFGMMKYDRWHKRLVRRGQIKVELDIYLVSIGFNLHKFYTKQIRLQKLKGAVKNEVLKFISLQPPNFRLFILISYKKRQILNEFDAF